MLSRARVRTTLNLLRNSARITDENVRKKSKKNSKIFIKGNEVVSNWPRPFGQVHTSGPLAGLPDTTDKWFVIIFLLFYLIRSFCVFSKFSEKFIPLKSEK